MSPRCKIHGKGSRMKTPQGCSDRWGVVCRRVPLSDITAGCGSSSEQNYPCSAAYAQPPVAVKPLLHAVTADETPFAPSRPRYAKKVSSELVHSGQGESRALVGYSIPVPSMAAAATLASGAKPSTAGEIRCGVNVGQAGPSQAPPPFQEAERAVGMIGVLP